MLYRIFKHMARLVIPVLERSDPEDPSSRTSGGTSGVSGTSFSSKHRDIP